jgi:hypothetical protein
MIARSEKATLQGYPWCGVKYHYPAGTVPALPDTLGSGFPHISIKPHCWSNLPAVRGQPSLPMHRPLAGRICRDDDAAVPTNKSLSGGVCAISANSKRIVQREIAESPRNPC